MDEAEVIDYIKKAFPEVETLNEYGYEMFFYKSDRKLSFATLISSDYEYDNVSNLNRPGVFRLNIGISKQTFQSLFGKDEVNVKDYDFTTLDVIMPHPEYAQYHFICVLSPSDKTFEKIYSLLAEAYDIAARRYASQNKNDEK
ncbi:MAG: hypothetical protein JNK32_04770 [Anaerolineales bacterium]|nr:hypothetical protein [Anaerolineales bacterium]